MAGAGAGAEESPGGLATPGAAGGATPRAGPDWAGGLPEDVLVKVAETLVAQAIRGENFGHLSEEGIHQEIARRKEDEDEEYMDDYDYEPKMGLGLFVFALVCKGWRKAQLKVGGRLCTRVRSDVLLPGGLALVKWALAEGCPRENDFEDTYGFTTMAHVAAEDGHLELVQWLCGEGGFAMDWNVMCNAADSGNLELVQWLRGEGCPWSTWTCTSAATYGHLEVLQWLHANGCPWDYNTCHKAVREGHVEMLRWARENGAPWTDRARDRAAAELGYTDDFGNLV